MPTTTSPRTLNHPSLRRKHAEARLCFLRAVAAGLLLALVPVLSARAATFVVTTTADGNHGDCTVSLCTLRDAIIKANATVGTDTITVPAGTYTLTIPGQGENAAATGDLDITDSVTINGAGAATTIVDGGALDRVFDVHPGTVIINDLTIRNGKPADNDNGGGISNTGTLTLNRCVVSGNATTGTTAGTGKGAGIYNNNDLTLNNCTVSGNVSTGGDGNGIYNDDALHVTDSTISGNTGGGRFGDGGGIYNNIASANLLRSTISGNSSGTSGSGGGIFANGSLVITNCTISGNTGGLQGGGLFNTGNSTTIKTTTIANNTAPSGQGGGIWVETAPTVTDTIVANNSGGNCSSAPTDGGTNLQFPGATCGTFLQIGDPQLGPLANNGGSTQTHALQAGSPAIDRATTGCPPPADDQRGVLRPQGGACDIGSFEFAVAAVTGTATSTPTATPTSTPTPTSTSVAATATATATSPPVGVVVPTLTFPMLGLLGLILAVAGTALLLLKRG
jgi:CSLREA domain-containing protein